MDFLFCLHIKKIRTRTAIAVTGTTTEIAKVAALFDLFPGGDGTIIGLLHILPSELKLKSHKTISSCYTLVQKEKQSSIIINSKFLGKINYILQIENIMVENDNKAHT